MESSLFNMIDTPAVPVHKRAGDTEIAAAGKVARVAPRLRRTALAWIKEAGDDGLTMKEAGARYAISRGRHPTDGSCRYSIAPRITELSQAGYVRDSGRRRDGAIVWVATDKAGEL